jgi:D-alanyl-lipoteichoic acid acyltransferase DltB (MBOAT superfamily)
MLFNSLIFPPFLVIVLGLYTLLRRRGQNVMLLLASYFFYACWDWRFLGLLLSSTTTDWALANLISRQPSRRVAKWYVAASVTINLVFLGFFKYFNFFVDSLSALLGALGLHGFDAHLRVILPVGISFYTFQSISYIVDVYRGDVEPAKNPIDFALFVAFFPHMVAGPIMHSSALLPQMRNPRHRTRAQVREGAWLMLWGFFKKLVIADNLAILVNQIFASDHPASAATVIVGVYAFAYQIYCDFSGYTDIARGVAKLMGFELMLNFNQPYLALNPPDFWRRWHISLSTWLRDYLYIPLGGNRLGRLMTYRNLMLTMALGGLWHGAAGNFLLWGLYHGGLLVVHRLVTQEWKLWPWNGWLARLTSRLIMFHAVCYGWLLFRATSLTQIRSFTRLLFVGPWTDSGLPALLGLLLPLVAMLWLVEAWVRNADDPTSSPGWDFGLGPVVCTLLIVIVLVLTPPGGGQSFIYFQF